MTGSARRPRGDKPPAAADARAAVVRAGGRRPVPEENKLGAWYVKTAIKGRPGGKLAGRRVVVLQIDVEVPARGAVSIRLRPARGEYRLRCTHRATGRSR